MKKICIATIIILLSFPAFSQHLGDTIISNNPARLKLKVLYFHITNRCNTCRSIEANVRKTIDSCFAKELHDGTLDLYIINCDLPENKEISVKYDAYGATLAFSAFVNGIEQKPDDITGWAFQKIHSPAVFIDELREKIAKQIK